MKFICRECGCAEVANTIEDIKRNKKLCTECLLKNRSMLHNKHRNVDIECKNCNKIFKGFKNSSLFCSTKCSEEYNKSKKVINICEECGGEFEKNNKVKYCSNECRSKGRSKIFFRNSLAKANTAIEQSKVKVYGENINYSYTNERSNRSSYHKDGAK